MRVTRNVSLLMSGHKPQVDKTPPHPSSLFFLLGHRKRTHVCIYSGCYRAWSDQKFDRKGSFNLTIITAQKEVALEGVQILANNLYLVPHTYMYYTVPLSSSSLVAQF